MQNKYKKIIIDSNNLYYRNFEVNKNLSYTVNGSPMHTGGIYGSLRSVFAYYKKYLLSNLPDSEIIFTFDNHASKNNLRKQIDENYKCNRIERSKKFYKGIDYLEKIFLNLYDNAKVIRISYMEADDLIPAILNNFNKNDKILLISNDEDWCRSITDNIHVLKNNEIITKYSYKEKHGFFPNIRNITLYKSFKGDTSDNIPNPIKRFPHKVLIELMNYDFEDIWDFFYKFDKGEFNNILSEDINATWYNKLKDNSKIRKRLILNWRLVDYMGCPEADFQNGTYQCKFNSIVLRTLYSVLGFNIEKLDYRLIYDNTNRKTTAFF